MTARDPMANARVARQDTRGPHHARRPAHKSIAENARRPPTPPCAAAWTHALWACPRGILKRQTGVNSRYRASKLPAPIPSSGLDPAIATPPRICARRSSTDQVSGVTALVDAGLVAFHGKLPGEARHTVIVAGALVGIGIIGLGILWIGRGRVEGRLPHRWQGQFARLNNALFACLRRPGRLVGMSVAIWISDGVRLLMVSAALGQALPLSTAIFVALMSSMLTTLPITPAGLGVVEAAMIVVLELVGIGTAMATSIALMDRVITYWSLIVFGLILYLVRMRAELRSQR